MQIHGPSHVHGSHPVNAPHRARPNQATQPPAQSTRGVDELDISPEAELVSRVRDLPDVRADRVAQIRAEIESGVYETDEKLDIALDRLLDELA